MVYPQTNIAIKQTVNTIFFFIVVVFFYFTKIRLSFQKIKNIQVIIFAHPIFSLTFARKRLFYFQPLKIFITMSTTTLPPLPFKADALAPHLSEQTLNFHHKKHHQTYVDNLNKLAVGTPFENAKLEEIIKKSDGAIYNNAAQVWNHTFYFNQFAAKATPTTGILADAIAKKWGSFSAFKNEFNAAGATLFGSGWVFLVCKDNSDLQIVKEPNAGNPLTKNLLPLLTFDVWEHAYYLDYQNRRGDYLNALWQILDWKVIERRFAECTQHSEIFL